MTPRKMYGRAVRRFGRTFTLLAIVGLVAAGSAAAYYALTFSGVSGGGTQPNAASGGVNGTTPAITAVATWGAAYPGSDPGNGCSGTAQALYPGNSSPLCVNYTNVSPTPTTISSLTATVTTSNPSCLPAWFQVNLGSQIFGSSLPVTLSAGSTKDNGGGGTISFLAENTDQSSCESATVTVSITGNAS